MRIFILFLLQFFISIITVNARLFSIKGNIKDATAGKAIAGASVFLSNTSYGTISTSNGSFELINIKPGKYDLVVSCIGYATYTSSIEVHASLILPAIAIEEKSAMLQEVIVSSYEKDGWQKYGRFFLENFIGTTALSDECIITNTNVIRFSFSRQSNELNAYAYEPLIIENKALGYTIQYQLEVFNYNYNEHYLYFAGYPLFTEMNGNTARQKRWQKRRLEVYNISFTRFMRSLYRNRLKEDGYALYALERLPNFEKQRLQLQQKKYYDTVSRKTTIRNYETTLPPDSMAYYEKIMHQKDPIEIIHPGILQGDQIAYGEDSVTAMLDFKNYVIVRYLAQTNPPEYAQQIDASTREPVTSIIVLPQEVPIKVTASGYYYEVQNIMIEGFWAWWEKLATLLPFDYTPVAGG